MLSTDASSMPRLYLATVGDKTTQRGSCFVIYFQRPVHTERTYLAFWDISSSSFVRHFYSTIARNYPDSQRSLFEGELIRCYRIFGSLKFRVCSLGRFPLRKCTDRTAIKKDHSVSMNLNSKAPLTVLAFPTSGS